MTHPPHAVGAEDTAADLLEELDESGRPTGRLISREQAHREGLWHAVIHLWVLTPEGSLLLQRRSHDKDLAGGLLDVTVGGHLAPGEPWVTALLRETEEEIGLSLRPIDLHYLGYFPKEYRFPEATDREFEHTAAAVVDQPLEGYTLRKGEVDVLYELPLERALALYRDGTPVPVPGWDAYQRVNNALLVSEDLIQEGKASTLQALERLQAWWLAEGRNLVPARPLD